MSATSPKKAAIIGGGVIGGGWAARFLLHGWDVDIFDPDDQAPRKLADVLSRAREFLPQLADTAMPAEGELSFVDSIQSAVQQADWIQESAGERLELKHAIIAEIQKSAPPATIIGSSTSGFKPSQLQEGATHPTSIIVAHPFNPVYLLPLVEVVPGDQASAKLIDQAQSTLQSIGMQPLILAKQIEAHVADRLLEAVWRESLWLIHDDVATTQQIDDAIRYGFGLRWAQMGIFETYRLAGGEDGMHHFLEQFGPTLSWPWTKLMDVPDLNDDLITKIANQSDSQSGHMSISDLSSTRDRNLVSIMRALKLNQWGAGQILIEHDQRLANISTATTETRDDEPLRLFETQVPPAWQDYNGHMTEHRYLEVFGYATDAVLNYIGVTPDYVAAGHSYFTVETHIMHLDEVKVGTRLVVSTQLLHVDEKRLHLFHRIHRATDDSIVATAEQMLLHVNAVAEKASPAPAAILNRLNVIAKHHAELEKPGSSGRYVGQRSAG